MANTPREPHVTVNGSALEPKHTEVLRVAINHLFAATSEAGALGDDEIGEEIRRQYLASAAEVIRLMNWPQPPTSPHQAVAN